jgi:hypothetical protein
LPVSRLMFISWPANKSRYTVGRAFLLAVVNAGRYDESMSSLLSVQKPQGIENSVRLSYLLDGESAVDWQGDSGDVAARLPVVDLRDVSISR